MLFFLIPHGRCSLALVSVCVLSVCMCVAKGEGDEKEGAGQMIRTSL